MEGVCLKIMPTDKERIAAYLDASVKRQLLIRAKREGRSLSNYVEQLIKEHLGIELSEEELAELAKDDE